jgi:hypothetical protein
MSATYYSDNYASDSDPSPSQVICNPPAGIQDGDMLIAFTSEETNMVVTPPAGFVAIDAAINSGGIQAWYKIASSESGSYLWQFASTTSGLHVCMVCVKKDSGDWVVPTMAGYHSNATSDTAVVETGEFTSQNGSCLLASWYDDNHAEWVTGVPDGMEEVVNQTIGTCRMITYYEDVITGVENDTKTVTWNTSNHYACLAVVVYAEGGTIAPTSIFYGSLMGPLGGPI